MSGISCAAVTVVNVFPPCFIPCGGVHQHISRKMGSSVGDSVLFCVHSAVQKLIPVLFFVIPKYFQVFLHCILQSVFLIVKGELCGVKGGVCVDFYRYAYKPNYLSGQGVLLIGVPYWSGRPDLSPYLHRICHRRQCL